MHEQATNQPSLNSCGAVILFTTLVSRRRNATQGTRRDTAPDTQQRRHHGEETLEENHRRRNNNVPLNLALPMTLPLARAPLEKAPVQATAQLDKRARHGRHNAKLLPLQTRGLMSPKSFVRVLLLHLPLRNTPEEL